MPRTPDHRAPLWALESFGSIAFATNPCRRARAAVVWSSGTMTDANFVDQFAFVRAPVDALESGADPDGVVRFRSDWYFCSGANTLGSGRAVIVDGYQVKGVGRTVQAPLTGIELMTDGRVRTYKAIKEHVRGLIVGRLLSVPAIPTLAFMHLHEARAADDDSFLVVRESVPLRLSHLMFFTGAGQRLAQAKRMASWRTLFNRAVRGRDGFALTEAQILAGCERIVANAVTLAAEARVFGVFLSNWADNAELHARVFDFEDVRFDFGQPLTLPSHPHVARHTGERPFDYFTRQPFDGDPGNVAWCALLSVANAFAALGMLAEGMGFDRAVLARTFGWSRLEALYTRALAAAIVRLCGLPPRTARTSAVITVVKRIARELPLAPVRAMAPFSPAELLEAFVATARGTRPGAGAAAAAGNRLALAVRARDAATASRIREHLDGEHLAQLAIGYRERGEAIAQQPGSIESRSPMYRALFATISDDVAASVLPTA